MADTAPIDAASPLQENTFPFRAYAAYEAGDARGAEQAARAAIGQEGDALALLLLACLLAGQGRKNELEALAAAIPAERIDTQLRAPLESPQRFADALVAAAELLATSASDWAGQLLHAALWHAPQSPRAACALASFLLNAGAYDQAARGARHAVAAAPEQPSGWQLLGRIHLAGGDAAAALAAVREALVRAADDPDTLMLLGEVQIARAAWSDAIAYLERGLALQGRADLACMLARAFEGAGRFAEADAAASRAAALDPDHPEVRLLAARRLARKGRLAPARALLEELLAGQPDLVAAQRQLARLLEQQGEHALAGRAWQRVADLKTGDREAPLAAARSLHRAGLGKAAADWLGREAAARLAPLEIGLFWLEQEAPDLAARAHPPQEGDEPAELAWRGALRLAEGRGDGVALLTRALEAAPHLGFAHRALARHFARRGLGRKALAHARKLVDLAPADAAALELLSRLLLAAHRPRAAADAARAALALDPERSVALTLVGQAMLATGHIAAAAEPIRAAYRGAPLSVDAHMGLIELLLERRHHRAALHQSQRLLAHAPQAARAHALMGWALFRLDGLAAAEQAALRAIALERKNGRALLCLAAIAERRGDLAGAAVFLQTAIKADPDDPEAQLRMASLCLRRLELAAARRAAMAALRRAPPASSLAWAAAALLLDLDLPGPAARAARAMLAAVPDWPDAATLLGRALLRLGKLRAAAKAAGAALRPGLADADLLHLLLRLRASGETTAGAALARLPRRQVRHAWLAVLERAFHFESDLAYRSLAQAALADFPEDAEIGAVELLARHFDPAATPADLQAAARRWSAKLCPAAPLLASPLPARAKSAPTRRIAYLAKQLHPPLLRSFLNHHRFADYEITLFTDDDVGALGALDPHIRLYPISGIDVSEICSARGIDIAVDLMGPIPMGGNIAGFDWMRRRVAPIQVRWLNHGTTASAAIYDFLLADESLLPDSTEPYFEETVLALPRPAWCWMPPALACMPAAAPKIRNGFVTFGSAARGVKLNAALLRSWAEILHAAPGSRLSLIGQHAAPGATRAHIIEQLASHAIAPARIEFHAFANTRDYYDWYRGIDVVLDAFPNSGCLTLCDALWMGVPVATRAGATLASRQAASLLGAVGKPDWIAADEGSYRDSALRLAHDPRARLGLREALLASPVADGADMARALEAAFERMIAAPEGPAAAKDLARGKAQRRLERWLAAEERLAFATPAAPDVSILLVLHNEAGLSFDCLRSIAEAGDEAASELIILDNGSSDATGALLDRISGARLLRNPGNEGYLLAVNRAARLARGRYLLLLNNDARLRPGSLAAALRRMRGDATIGAVGGRVVLADGHLQEAGCGIWRDGRCIGLGRGADPAGSEFQYVREVDFCSAAFLMVERALFEALGGFEEAFAPAYYEDADLCLRIRASGRRVIYDPAVIVDHLEFGSAGSGEQAIALQKRNRATFRAKQRAYLAAKPPPASVPWVALRDCAPSRGRVLMIDDLVPDPTLGGGTPRAQAIACAIRDLGYELTFFPAQPCTQDWSQIRRILPETIEVIREGGIAAAAWVLELRRGYYDRLLVSRPHNFRALLTAVGRNMHLLEELQLIYDAEALFAARALQAQRVAGEEKPSRRAEQQLRAELALARRADRILAVSEAEAARFRSAGAADVRVLGHALVPGPTRSGFAARDGLLLVGALRRGSPNVDGLLWFAREVLPLLWQLLGRQIPVLAAGHCEIALPPDSPIELLGPVSDLTPLYERARLFVAPTRIAAGLPHKAHEAAARGLPIVTTTLIAGQLGWRDGIELLAEDSAPAFASALARLYGSSELWHSIRGAALARVATDCAPDHFRASLSDALSAPIDRRLATGTGGLAPSNRPDRKSRR